MQGFLSLTPRLTECRCDCCGLLEDDEVTHLLVAEAVLMHLRAMREKESRDRAAWADAHEQAQGALDAAKAARG